MKHYAGIEVMFEAPEFCVVDAEGGIVRERKVLSEPDALIAEFQGMGAPLERISFEAGPLWQSSHAAMAERRDPGRDLTRANDPRRTLSLP